MDELRHSFLLTMEIEDTKLKAQEELKARDEQIRQLKELLKRVIKERNEAQEKCQKALFEKLWLQNQIHHSPRSGVSSIEEFDDPRRGFCPSNGLSLSSSDCDESIVSSPRFPALEFCVQPKTALPQQGQLLEAVVKAGPLLQNLLLAGPLPQWRHPPPMLDACHIPPPPVAILGVERGGGRMERKRGIESDGSDSSVELKHRRVVLQ